MRHNRDRQETPAGVNLRPGRMVSAALLLVVGAFAVEALLGTQGSIDRLFNDWIYYGLLLASGGLCLARALLVRAERLPWLLLSAALLLWAAGDLYWYVVLSRPGEHSIPVRLRRLLPRLLPGQLRGARALAPKTDPQVRGQPLARRADRRSGRRCSRRRRRLRPGAEHDRWEHARRRDEPRVSPRRPSAALARRRHVRADRLALRPHLGIRRRRLRRVRDRRHRVPLPGRRRELHRGRPPRRGVACRARPDRLRCLAARDEASGRTHRELEDAHPPHVLRPDQPDAPRLRPFRAHQHRGYRSCVRRDRNGDRARSPHVPRARSAARVDA